MSILADEEAAYYLSSAGGGEGQPWPAMVDFKSPNTSRYYLSASGFAIAAPYTIGMRLNVIETTIQRILYGYGGTYPQLYLVDSDAKYYAYLEDTNYLISSSAPGGDSTNRCMFIQGGASGHKLYFAEESQAATLQASNGSAASSMASNQAWVGYGPQLYTGLFADLFVLTIEADAASKASFAAGYDPATIWGSDCQNWWQFYSALASMPDQQGNGPDFTRNGTGW